VAVGMAVAVGVSVGIEFGSVNFSILEYVRYIHDRINKHNTINRIGVVFFCNSFDNILIR